MGGSETIGSYHGPEWVKAYNRGTHSDKVKEEKRIPSEKEKKEADV